MLSTVKKDCNEENYCNHEVEYMTIIHHGRMIYYRSPPYIIQRICKLGCQEQYPDANKPPKRSNTTMPLNNLAHSLYAIFSLYDVQSTQSARLSVNVSMISSAQSG